jgi:hypothetical protein
MKRVLKESFENEIPFESKTEEELLLEEDNALDEADEELKLMVFNIIRKYTSAFPKKVNLPGVREKELGEFNMTNDDRAKAASEELMALEEYDPAQLKSTRECLYEHYGRTILAKSNFFGQLLNDISQKIKETVDDFLG